MKMIANYHTHTVRCGHASAEDERAYVEAAIAAGFEELGFSDHCPMPVPEGADISKWAMSIRMKTEETEDYVGKLLCLREEYKNDIKIHIGFEAEYYPETFDGFIEFIGQFPTDYIILGQHFSSVFGEPTYHGTETRSKDVLKRYVDQICGGMETGKFTYLAHPDLCPYRGDLGFYEEQMTRVITCANKHNVPLEINLLGIDETRAYPTMSFWTLASEIGCDVVIGSDAHNTRSMYPEKAVYYAHKIIEKNSGLRLLDKVKLIRPI